MKTLIEVKDYTPAQGKEYESASWPGPGMYKTVGNQWFLVYPVGLSHCVLSVGTSASCPLPTVETPPVPKPIEPQPLAITASDLLKAIAISQNPLLAKELLK